MAETRILGKNARLYFGDLPLYLKMFEMELGMELNLEDSTPYAVDWRESVLVDGQLSMVINAFMDTARPPVSDPVEDYVSDQAYWDAAITGAGKINPTATPVIFVIRNTALIGEPAYFLRSQAGSIAINCPRAALGRIRGNFGATGRINRGIILAQLEQEYTGTIYIPLANGTDCGLPLATNIGADAVLCVWKKSGVGSFTISIEDCATVDGEYLPMIAFTALTTRTAEYKEDRVDAAKRYQRVKVVATGTETLGIIVVSAHINQTFNLAPE